MVGRNFIKNIILKIKNKTYQKMIQAYVCLIVLPDNKIVHQLFILKKYKNIIFRIYIYIYIYINIKIDKYTYRNIHMLR